MSVGTPNSCRHALAALLAFVALNAAGGGYYGMSGAAGVPVSWLEGSPFDSYLVPSVVLFVVVGGTTAVAAVAVLLRRRSATRLSLAAAGVLFAWLAVQVAIIGYVSWMQPATAMAGLFILLLIWPYRRGPEPAQSDLGQPPDRGA